MQSIEDTEVSKCIEEYLKCMEMKGALLSKNRDKSFTHAYLASTEDPVARVGEGAKQKAWNLDAQAFTGISKFLRDLVSLDTQNST